MDVSTRRYAELLKTYLRPLGGRVLLMFGLLLLGLGAKLVNPQVGTLDQLLDSSAEMRKLWEADAGD